MIIIWSDFSLHLNTIGDLCSSFTGLVWRSKSGASAYSKFMFLITFGILRLLSQSFLTAAYYGTSLYPTRIKLSHFGLIDSTVKGRIRKEKQKKSRETLWIYSATYQHSIDCVCHIGGRTEPAKGEKISPQDMIMIQLIFMMAVDWVPLKIREQSMALKVNRTKLIFFSRHERWDKIKYWHTSLDFGSQAATIGTRNCVYVFLSSSVCRFWEHVQRIRNTFQLLGFLLYSCRAK